MMAAMDGPELETRAVLIITVGNKVANAPKCAAKRAVLPFASLSAEFQAECSQCDKNKQQDVKSTVGGHPRSRRGGRRRCVSDAALPPPPPPSLAPTTGTYRPCLPMLAPLPSPSPPPRPHQPAHSYTHTLSLSLTAIPLPKEFPK